MKREYDMTELATMKAFYQEYLDIVAKEENIQAEKENLSNYVKQHRKDIPLVFRSWLGDITHTEGRRLSEKRRYVENCIDDIEREKYELESKIMRIYGSDEDEGQHMVEIYQDLYNAKLDEVSQAADESTR